MQNDFLQLFKPSLWEGLKLYFSEQAFVRLCHKMEAFCFVHDGKIFVPCYEKMLYQGDVQSVQIAEYT